MNILPKYVSGMDSDDEARCINKKLIKMFNIEEYKFPSMIGKYSETDRLDQILKFHKIIQSIKLKSEMNLFFNIHLAQITNFINQNPKINITVKYQLIYLCKPYFEFINLINSSYDEKNEGNHDLTEFTDSPLDKKRITKDASIQTKHNPNIGKTRK